MYGNVIEIVLFSAERSAERILHKSNVYTYSLKYSTDCLFHHEIEIVNKYTPVRGSCSTWWGRSTSWKCCAVKITMKTLIQPFPSISYLDQVHYTYSESTSFHMTALFSEVLFLFPHTFRVSSNVRQDRYRSSIQPDNLLFWVNRRLTSSRSSSPGEDILDGPGRTSRGGHWWK